MSRVRLGTAEHGEHGQCLFCGNRVTRGAYWMGTLELWICSACVRDGRLGKLIGDAARDAAALEHILEATAKQAWRSLALAKERK